MARSVGYPHRGNQNLVWCSSNVVPEFRRVLYIPKREQGRIYKCLGQRDFLKLPVGSLCLSLNTKADGSAVSAECACRGVELELADFVKATKGLGLGTPVGLLKGWFATGNVQESGRTG